MRGIDDLLTSQEKRKSTDPSPAKKRKVDPDNPQTNQAARKESSKKKKEQKKADREEVPDQKFDFGVDFWSNTTPVKDITTKSGDGIQVDDADAFTF